MRMWNRYDYLYPIDDAFEFGWNMTAEIEELIEGGVGCPSDDGAIFAQAVKNAGDGDYLELGTLYGGSAILASLTKKKYGIKGEVYCVDDLVFQGEKRSAATIMHNAEKMGASINLKVAKTCPLPFADKKFNCILIDAAHDVVSVFADWISVLPVATRYVMFHDYTPEYPGIMHVVKIASFYPVYIAAHTAVLENFR